MIKLLILFFSFPVFSSSNFHSQLKELVLKDPQLKEVKNQEQYIHLDAKSSFSNLILPELSLVLSKNQEESFGTNNEVESELAKLNLNYSIFSFGSDWNDYRAKKAQIETYSAHKDQTYIIREKKMALLLLNRVKSFQDLKIQNEIISLKKNSLKIAKKKYQTGSLSKNDLLRVKIDLTNAQSEILALQQRMANSLNELYGVSDKELIDNFPWSDFFQRNGLSKINGIEFSPEQTPLGRKLENTLQERNQNAKSISLSHLGRFSLTYSRNIYREKDIDDLYGWSASINYTLPIFENFNREKEVQKAKAEARTALEFSRYNKHTQQKKYQSKRNLLKTSLEIFKGRLNTYEDSKELFQNMLSRFKKGMISVNELFFEQDRLLATKKLTNAAVYNLHINYLDFLHLHGIAITKEPTYIK